MSNSGSKRLIKTVVNVVIFKSTNFKSYGFRYFEFEVMSLVDRFTPLRRKPST
jgi:hypothetical protein